MSLLYFGVLFQNVIFLKMFTTSVYLGFGLVTLLDLSVSGFCTLGGELRAWKLRPLGWFYYYHQSLWEVWVHLYPYAQILVAHFPFPLPLLVHTFHFPLEQFPFWCYSKYFVLFELGILVEYFSYFDSVHKFFKVEF